MEPPGLLRLPPELLIQIFTILPTYASVVRLAHTHPTLRNVLALHHSKILPKPHFTGLPCSQCRESRCFNSCKCHDFLKALIPWSPKHTPYNWSLHDLINGTWNLLSGSVGRLVQTLGHTHSGRNSNYYTTISHDTPICISLPQLTILSRGFHAIPAYPPTPSQILRLRYTTEVETGLLNFVNTSYKETAGEILPSEAQQAYKSFGRTLLQKDLFDDVLERLFLRGIYYTHTMFLRDPWLDNFDEADAYVQNTMLSYGEIENYVNLLRVREELEDKQLARGLREWVATVRGLLSMYGGKLGRRGRCANWISVWHREEFCAQCSVPVWMKTRFTFFRRAVELVEGEMKDTRSG